MVLDTPRVLVFGIRRFEPKTCLLPILAAAHQIDNSLSIEASSLIYGSEHDVVQPVDFFSMRLRRSGDFVDSLECLQIVRNMGSNRSPH